jgi:hypothetical protein
LPFSPDILSPPLNVAGNKFRLSAYAIGHLPLFQPFLDCGTSVALMAVELIAIYD